MDWGVECVTGEAGGWGVCSAWMCIVCVFVAACPCRIALVHRVPYWGRRDLRHGV